MATVSESAATKTELGSGLAQGVETVSINQEVTFTLYVKLILPLDGYVFWVNASLLSDTALYNAAQYNRLLYDNNPLPVPAKQIKAQGSFHVSIDMHQLEERFTAYNHITFTSLHPIQDFNLVNPNMIYVASYQNTKFAFSRRDAFYKQADLYHYRGDSLYSIMDTQLIDTMTGFDTQKLIVSNSLPIWLTLNQFFPMYPSFLVGQNIAPPYCAVDIDPARTNALQDFPLLDHQGSPKQLVTDMVKLSIFGQDNNQALNFVQYVLDYSRNTDNIGIMNMPVMQDEKVTQPEFGIIAQKKIITFQVSYYQSTVNDIARQQILHSFMSVNFAQ